MREDKPKLDPVREATLWVHGGMALTVVLILGFNLRLEVALLDSIFTAVLLAAMPVITVAQLPFVSAMEMERLRAYVGSAGTILVLAAVALILGALGPGLGAMGLDPAVDARGLGIASAALLGATGLVGGIFHLVSRRGGIPESPMLERLIPRTAPERRVFVGLSLAAGFGEEIVYRGYLLAILTPALGDPWTAAGVSSVAFGLLHAYQGALGILRTGALGMLFAASLVLTGQLWSAIAVHIVVDLVGGLWLGPRMLLKDGDAD